MIEVNNGLVYYLDIDKLMSELEDEKLNERYVTESETETEYNADGEIIKKTVKKVKRLVPKEINSVKHELYSNLVNILFSIGLEDIDSDTKVTLNNIPISSKIAFNSLINKKIIIEI